MSEALAYVYIIIFVLGRIILGGYFLMNAYNHFRNYKGLAGYAMSKGVSAKMANIAIFGTGALLLLGGLGMLLGIYTEVAVLLLTVFFIGVSFKMHAFWKIEDPMQKMMEKTNFFKNLALMGSLWVILPWGNTPVWQVINLLIQSI